MIYSDNLVREWVKSSVTVGSWTQNGQCYWATSGSSSFINYPVALSELDLANISVPAVDNQCWIGATNFYLDKVADIRIWRGSSGTSGATIQISLEVRGKL